MFLCPTWLIYTSHSSVCIVHTLCEVAINVVCYNGEIELARILDKCPIMHSSDTQKYQFNYNSNYKFHIKITGCEQSNHTGISHKHTQRKKIISIFMPVLMWFGEVRTNPHFLENFF